MNRVTVKTLRHYETMGLLSPAGVDELTGYRYYEASQMPALHKIVALKQAGCSLREIKDLLDSSSTETLLKSLNSNLKNLSGEVVDIQARISHTKSYINFIEEKDIMAKEVVIKELPEIIVASSRKVIPNYESLYEEAPKMGKMMKKHGAVCADSKYCFNIYHDAEYKKENIDVEMCEEVVKKLPGSDGVEYRTMPKIEKAACILHEGPFSTLGSSYSIVFEWIEQNNFSVAGPFRESFIDGPWNKENDAEWFTEIQIPVARIS